MAIPFTHYDFGYPATHRLHRFDPHPRMYRRGAVEWPSEPNRNPVVAEGRMLWLPESDEVVMIHDRNRSVVEALDRVVRYAPAQAQAMIDRGEVFEARRMFATLRGKLRKQFIHGEPWLDGMPGMLRAVGARRVPLLRVGVLLGALRGAEDRRGRRVRVAVVRPGAGSSRPVPSGPGTAEAASPGRPTQRMSRVRTWIGDRVRARLDTLLDPRLELATATSAATKSGLRELFVGYRSAVREEKQLPPLRDVGFRVFSEVDEDGILLFCSRSWASIAAASSISAPAIASPQATAPTSR